MAALDVKSEKRKVAVLGGGVAGLAAARHLGEAGFIVILFERFDLLGGKVKGWETIISLADDKEVPPQAVEHGVHGWWRTYLNFERFFDERCATPEYQRLKKTWWINGPLLGRSGSGLSEARTVIDKEMSDHLFKLLERWGLFRLLNPKLFKEHLALLRAGIRVVGFRDVIRLGIAGLGLKCRLLAALLCLISEPFRFFVRFLSSEPDEGLDALSVTEIAQKMGIRTRTEAHDLLDVVTAMGTYGRSSKQSAFHVAKLLDFYFLRTPDTMWFEVLPDSTHRDAVLPLVLAAQEAGAEIRTQAQANAIHNGTRRRFSLSVFSEGVTHPEEFDHIVISTEPSSTQRLLEASQFPGSDRIRDKIAKVPSTQLTVIRIWFRNRFLNRSEVPIAMPIAGAEEAECPFDFVFIPSLFQQRAANSGGEVIEFHISYSDRFDTPGHPLSHQKLIDDTIEWALRIFPELKDADPIYHRSAINEIRNYSGAPPGHLETAPRVSEEADGIYFCGDWVYYPNSPVSYMEKSMVTGIEAARAVCDAVVVRGPTSNSVPEIIPLPRAQYLQVRAAKIAEKFD